MKVLVSFFLVLSLCGCASLSSRESATTPPQKVQLVDAIFVALNKNYAPLYLKAEAYGLNLDEERDKIRKILYKKPLLSDDDFRGLLHQLFASLRDAHSGIFFKDNKVVSLGFVIKSVGPKYYISWIDRERLPKSKFAPDVGDEILTIDDQKIADVYADIVKQSGFRVSPLAEKTFNERLITSRSANDGVKTPAVGQVAKIALREGATYSLEWMNEGGSPSFAGYIPYLGDDHPHEERSNYFRNYIFKRQGHTYGFVRVPTLQFSGEGQTNALAEFNRIIDRFNNAKVEKLVLDFTGNGGGNYLFAFGMLARLTDKKLQVPRQRYFVDADYGVVGVGSQSAIKKELKRITAIDSNVAAKKYLKTNAVFSSALAFEPKNLKTLQKYRRFLEDLSHTALQSKEGSFTEPLPQILPSIEPGKDPFTGKILVVTDEMTISAPEFAAAALLDNGRAETFGATTMGAGGDQRCFLADAEVGRPPELFQLKQDANLSALMREAGIAKFCVTATVGLRVNSKGDIIGPFENFGVPAGVTYTVTHDDLAGGYRGYRAALLKSLDEL